MSHDQNCLGRIAGNCPALEVGGRGRSEVASPSLNGSGEGGKVSLRLALGAGEAGRGFELM